jgi:serine phosphatase RsbU (regulator of sigma subunit)
MVLKGKVERSSLVLPPSTWRLSFGILVAAVGFPIAVVLSTLGPMAQLAGLPFVAVVIVATALGRLALGGVSVVLATLLLDYFVIPPTGTLNPERASDYVALALFATISLGTAVAISYLDRVNAERKLANARLEFVATSLQRGLLPSRLPQIPSVDIAVGYWPAGEGIEVGGDFYDVFQPDGNRLVVVVGDVAGKGPEAAAFVGAARHILRTLASQEHAPGDLLRHLNKFLLQEMAEGQFCTVCIAVLDLDDHDGAELIVASGGHPAPTIVRGDGTIHPAPTAGTLLGLLEGVIFEEYSTRLRRGDTLALYTDGLYERPRGDASKERDVSALLLGAESVPVQNALERIEGVLQDEVLFDDAALVLVRKR